MPQTHRLFQFSRPIVKLDIRSSLCPFLYPIFNNHSLIQPVPRFLVAGHRFTSSENRTKRRAQLRREELGDKSKDGVHGSSTLKRSINPDDPPDVQESDERNEQKAGASSPRMPSDASTLTEPERLIFEKLYDSMYYRTKQKDAVDLSKYAELIEGSGPDRGDDRELVAIFDDLLQKSESRNEAFQDSSAENDPSSEGANRRPSGWVLPSQFKGTKRLKRGKPFSSSDSTATYEQQAQMAEQQAIIEKRARINLVRINDKLENTQTDVEIWRVLEGEVFSKMRALNARFEADEKERRKAVASQNQKAKKKKSKKTQEDKLKKAEKEEKIGKEEAMEAEKEPDTISSEDAPTDQSLLSASTAVIPTPAPNPIHPLQIATPIYGPSLLHAARLYRTRFPRSPYALSLLSKIKEYGPFSYVLGASTALYNELLYLTWVHYRDLDGCAQLVEEMVARGLQIDRRTVAVIEDAKRVRDREKSVGAMVRKSTMEDEAAGEAKEAQTSSLISAEGTKAEISGEQPELLGDVGGEANIDLGRQIVHVPERQGPPGVTYGTVYAGWWRMQGTSAGWRRWKNAHVEAVRRWAEDQKRAEEEKRAAEDEKVAAAKAASEMGEDETAEPEVTVFNNEEEEQEVEKVAAGGAG